MNGNGRPLTGSPHAHSNVLEHLPHQDGEDTRHEEVPEPIAGHLSNTPDTPQHHCEQHKHDRAAQCTELLTDRREREVSELHRDVLTVREGPSR